MFDVNIFLIASLLFFCDADLQLRRLMGKCCHTVTTETYDIKTRQDKTLFTLGPLLNGVGGIYTKYVCKTRDKMVEKHITKYLKIQINI